MTLHERLLGIHELGQFCYGNIKHPKWCASIVGKGAETLHVSSIGQVPLVRKWRTEPRQTSLRIVREWNGASFFASALCSVDSLVLPCSVPRTSIVTLFAINQGPFQWGDCMNGEQV